jgi:hypothetical protein
MTASQLQHLIEVVEQAPPAPLPSGDVNAAAELANVEASIRWMREYLAGSAG